jgi:protease I
MKKVLMIIASRDFRDPEYFEPKKALEAKGISVITASNSKTSTGAEGATVNVDILLKDAKASDHDAIAFIGGPGSTEYFKDAKAHTLARDILAQGKVLGAICASVATIANAGVLKGKKATSHGSVTDIVKAGGAIYTGEPVTTDGNIVTADGPKSAKAFGEALAKAMLK